MELPSCSPSGSPTAKASLIDLIVQCHVSLLRLPAVHRRNSGSRNFWMSRRPIRVPGCDGRKETSLGEQGNVLRETRPISDFDDIFPFISEWHFSPLKVHIDACDTI